MAARTDRWGRRLVRRLRDALLLFIGASFLSFVLVVYLGPDLTYQHLSKNPSAEEIAQVRAQLGYDQPLLQRYGHYLYRLTRGDLGRSDESGESNARILARAIPVSLAVLLPGFVLGHLLGLVLAMYGAWWRNGWRDRGVSGLAVLGMSLSFPVVIILAQAFLSSEKGLGWFPVQGWRVYGVLSYLEYAAVPALALLIVTLGYNVRYYRAVMVEELGKDYVLTARAFGAGALTIMLRHVLPNALIPMVTRVLFSLPGLLIGGSLLLEKHFSIPGVGLVTYHAVTGGDQSMVLAIVTLTALLFVVMNQSIDLFYRWVDPRLRDQRRSA